MRVVFLTEIYLVLGAGGAVLVLGPPFEVDGCDWAACAAAADVE